jgi:hypothetical protein
MSRGTVAFAGGGLGQAVLMRRRYSRVTAPRSGFAGFRFPPEVITLAVRWYLPMNQGGVSPSRQVVAAAW